MTKRICAALTVQSGLVYLTKGFKVTSCIGRLEFVLEEFDRWQIDEIVVLEISKGKQYQLNPNEKTLNAIANVNLSTPITYGGGINCIDDLDFVSSHGIERFALTQAVLKKGGFLELMNKKYGKQAFVGVLPFFINKKNAVSYCIPFSRVLSPKEEVKLFDNINEYFSETLLISINDEGFENLNDFNHFTKASIKLKTDLIWYGGFKNSIGIINAFNTNKNLKAIALSNFLTYKENCSVKIKEDLKNNLSIRPFQ